MNEVALVVTSVEPVAGSVGAGSYAMEVLGELDAAVGKAQALGLLALPVDELDAFTVGLLGIAERMKALVASTIREADRACVAQRHSIASTTTYLADRTNGVSKTIAPSLTLGRWLCGYRVFADAWADGLVTEAHVRELKKLDNPRTRIALDRDQQMLVDLAQKLAFPQFVTALAYWLLHADPDGSLDPERQAAYGLTTRKDANGDIIATHRMDPVTGDAYLTMIEHEEKKIHQAQLEARKHNPDLPETTRKQRLSRAALRLMIRGFRRKDGSFPVPLFNIVMSQKVAEDLIRRMTTPDDTPYGELGFDPHNLPLSYGDIDQRCETIRGTPVDPRRLWPLLLVARCRRQIMGANSRTIDLGRDVRLFPKALKQALLVEARGKCTTRACDATLFWLVADHLTPWAKHGPTSTANGQITCEGDNHRKADN